MVKRNFLDRLKEGVIIGTGALGTMIQSLSNNSDLPPELLMLERPELLLQIHKEYLAAGAEMVETNTFGANGIKLASIGMADKEKEINELAVDLARKAAGGQAFIAGSIGPSGKLMEPYGDLSMEEARENYHRQLSYLVNAGIEVIIIETMSDLAELKAALIAAREFDLPVIAQMTYTEKARTLTGTPPEVAAIVMEALGADLVGVNCVAGLEEALPLLERISRVTSLPLSVYANAGIPVTVGGKTHYPKAAEDYVKPLADISRLNIGVIGGCCGTTPEYIREIKKKVKEGLFARKGPERGQLEDKGGQVEAKERPEALSLAGNREFLFLEEKAPACIIGEKINPTGREDIKKALREENWAYLRKLARDQVEAGAGLIDVNIGLPGIDKIRVMKRLIQELQLDIGVPLVIDSDDPAVLEAGLEVYVGKPVINSVNGEQGSMDQVFPLARKYGAAVIGLTLDEQGIPATVEGRIQIARRIIDEAARYGIGKEDIIIDTLAMTAGSNQEGVMVTLETLKRIKEELGVKTALGISNVSHGLPERGLLNRTFLTMALGAGLDLPIADPFDLDLQDLVRAANLITGRDQDGRDYVGYYGRKESPGEERREGVEGEERPDGRIKEAILAGNSEGIIALLKASLAGQKAEDIVDNILIPTIREVGDLYEKGIYYLPQLLKSAETVQLAFDHLKKYLSTEGKERQTGTILLASVKGDIHDIGKNIVKVVFLNHGYEVIDLGTNVDPELIAETALEKKVDFVGLSSLMTTTLGAMEETIRLLQEKGFQGKTIIGGAVTSQEYADEIGADLYARDALDGVRKANTILGL
ncbi:MAG: homocysteine S-methyltransferase family protein [Halanaerobiales bacterium]|jgi:5-methyltetrahydrofolate--homocysteine methyltransferase